MRRALERRRDSDPEATGGLPSARPTARRRDAVDAITRLMLRPGIDGPVVVVVAEVPGVIRQDRLAAVGSYRQTRLNLRLHSFPQSSMSLGLTALNCLSSLSHVRTRGGFADWRGVGPSRGKKGARGHVRGVRRHLPTNRREESLDSSRTPQTLVGAGGRSGEWSEAASHAVGSR
jgi:hypothetical protein